MKRKDLLIAAALGAATAATVALISAHDPASQSALTDLGGQTTAQPALTVVSNTDPIDVPEQAPAIASEPTADTPAANEAEPVVSQGNQPIQAEEQEPVTVLGEPVLSYVPASGKPGYEDAVCTYSFSDDTTQSRTVGQREVQTPGKPRVSMECPRW